MEIDLNKGNKSTYLRVSDVKDEDIIAILDPGRWVESKFTYEDGTPKQNLEFAVNFQGKQLKYNMNKTSQINMSESFGNKTEDWVGKCAKIFVMPTPRGDTKMIVLKPTTQQEPAKIPEVQEEW